MGGEAPSNDPLPGRPQEVPRVLHPAQATPSDNPHLTLHSQSNMHCASHSWCGVGTLECLLEPALFRMPLSPSGLRDGRWAFVSLFWDPEHRAHTAPPFLPFQAFRARANKWGRGWRVCCIATWPTKLSVLDPKCP